MAKEHELVVPVFSVLFDFDEWIGDYYDEEQYAKIITECNTLVGPICDLISNQYKEFVIKRKFDYESVSDFIKSNLNKYDKKLIGFSGDAYNAYLTMYTNLHCSMTFPKEYGNNPFWRLYKNIYENTLFKYTGDTVNEMRFFEPAILPYMREIVEKYGNAIDNFRNDNFMKGSFLLSEVITFIRDNIRRKHYIYSTNVRDNKQEAIIDIDPEIDHIIDIHDNLTNIASDMSRDKIAAKSYTLTLFSESFNEILKKLLEMDIQVLVKYHKATEPYDTGLHPNPVED